MLKEFWDGYPFRWQLNSSLWACDKPKWVFAIVDRLNRAVDWIARVYYAHHNARVLCNMEHRMSILLSEATGGMLSKPYYEEDVLVAQIADYHERLCDEALEDFMEDLSDDLRQRINIELGRIDEHVGKENASGQ